MAIPKFLEDIAFVSKLGDNPGTDNGLTTEGFKAVFDKAAMKIQEYINTVIVPALDNATSGNVYSVANVKPDDSGNIPLTAADVKARPDTWTPSAAEVGAVTAEEVTTMIDAAISDALEVVENGTY